MDKFRNRGDGLLETTKEERDKAQQIFDQTVHVHSTGSNDAMVGADYRSSPAYSSSPYIDKCPPAYDEKGRYAEGHSSSCPGELLTQMSVGTGCNDI